MLAGPNAWCSLPGSSSAQVGRALWASARFQCKSMQVPARQQQGLSGVHTLHGARL